MWMTARRSGAEAPDKERELREEFVRQSGTALERLLVWLSAQAGSEAQWNGVPWWAKKMAYTLDGATLSVLKHQPLLEVLGQTELTVQRIVSGAKELQGGPDLTSLEVAMRRYLEFRRSP